MEAKLLTMHHGAGRGKRRGKAIAESCGQGLILSVLSYPGEIRQRVGTWSSMLLYQGNQIQPSLLNIHKQVDVK